MTEHVCSRTKSSKKAEKWCTVMPPDADTCCYKPAHFVKPGKPSHFGNIWLCAECYDDWMKGDCLA